MFRLGKSKHTLTESSTFMILDPNLSISAFIAAILSADLQFWENLITNADINMMGEM